MVTGLTSAFSDSSYYLSSTNAVAEPANAITTHYAILIGMFLLMHSASLDRKPLIFIAVSLSIWLGAESLRRSINCTAVPVAVVFLLL